MSRIEDAIKQAILASDKTRYRLAQITGISEAQLSRLMSGDRGLGLASAEKLAEALELEIIIRPAKRKAGKAKER